MVHRAAAGTGGATDIVQVMQSFGAKVQEACRASFNEAISQLGEQEEVFHKRLNFVTLEDDMGEAMGRVAGSVLWLHNDSK